jgi:hypothetical protein
MNTMLIHRQNIIFNPLKFYKYATMQTNGGLSVGIVRLRTKATELVGWLVLLCYYGFTRYPIPCIKLHGLSPRANYTDRATAACRRSDCQLLQIKGATWSA